MIVRVVSASLLGDCSAIIEASDWSIMCRPCFWLDAGWLDGKVIIWHDTWYKWTNLTQSEHHHNSQQLSTKHTTLPETDKYILNWISSNVFVYVQIFKVLKKSQLKHLNDVTVVLIREDQFCIPAFHQWSGEQWSGEHWGSYKCWESLFLSCNGGT